MTTKIHFTDPTVNDRHDTTIFTQLNTTLTRIHLWHAGTNAADLDGITDGYLTDLYPGDPGNREQTLTTAIERGLKTGTRKTRHTYYKTVLAFLYRSDQLLAFTTDPRYPITYPANITQNDYLALMVTGDYFWNTLNNDGPSTLTQTIMHAHAPHIRELKKRTYDDGARKLHFLNQLIQKQLVIEADPHGIQQIQADIASLEPTWVHLYKQVLNPTAVNPLPHAR